MIIRLNCILFLALTICIPAFARIGEDFDAITSRLGQPYVEQTDKGIYSWAIDEEQSLFLTVIVNKAGQSVSEQLRSHEGPLEEDKALQFFESQLGRAVTAEDFRLGGKVQFAGVKLDFGKAAQIFLDHSKEILCVWQEGDKPSASVYTREGAALRMCLEIYSAFGNF